MIKKRLSHILWGICGSVFLCFNLVQAGDASPQSAENPVATTEKGAAVASTDWASAADQSTKALLRRFWNSSDHYFNSKNDGLSKDFSYWPQAHAMDAVVDAYFRTQDPKYKTYFEPWFLGIRAKNGNRYWNPFYDDMEWIALTLLRIYEVSHEEKYLATAQKLWGFIKKGWDTEYAQGGVSWKSDQPWSKNACSNGPASILASRMYQITHDSSDKDWAIRVYQWEKEHLFNPETGAVADHINGQTQVKGMVPLSYNQGTFLGAAYELYKITGETLYLQEAQKAATFTVKSHRTLDQRNGVLRDEGRGDGGLFKGIFMRYFVQLLTEKKLEPENQALYRQFLYHNAKTLWEKGVQKEELLFNSSWTKPPTREAQLTSQVSACMCLEALAFYERSKK